MLKFLCRTTFLIFIFIVTSLSNQVYFTLINDIALTDEPRDLVIYNNKAYILTSSDLYSISANDPYNPGLTSYDGLETTRSIAFTSRYAYAIGGYDGIRYFDFASSPPIYKSKVLAYGDLKKIVIDNGYMYVVNSNMGLQVYDVGIADFPLYKNTQITPGNATGVFITDSKAYVTSSNSHLYIIDAGDISKLQVIGSYNFGSGIYEAFVDGHYAFLPQGSAGVQVINIAKLPFPELVVNIFPRKSSKQVVASNFYVWIADEYTVEAYFNITEKSYLFAGSYKNGDAVINRIAEIDGKYIYICSGDKSIKILKIDYKY